MRKRSISIKGHRTSILLEPEFWAAIEEAAARRGVSLPALVAEIDQTRMKSTPAPGLASSLRVFALFEMKSPSDRDSDVRDSGVRDSGVRDSGVRDKTR